MEISCFSSLNAPLGPSNDPPPHDRWSLRRIGGAWPASRRAALLAATRWASRASRFGCSIWLVALALVIASRQVVVGPASGLDVEIACAFWPSFRGEFSISPKHSLCRGFCSRLRRDSSLPEVRAAPEAKAEGEAGAAEAHPLAPTQQ